MQDYQACLAPSPIFLRQSARADTSGPQLGMRAAECELLCSTITFGDLDLTPLRPYAPTLLHLFRAAGGIREGRVWISDVIFWCAGSALA
jgi:hypothetical protein